MAGKPPAFFIEVNKMKQLFPVLLVVLVSLSVQGAFARDYRGAEIYSQESVLYGRFEIRMQVARGSGVLSTFFTYKNGSELANAFWEEIDIEVFGKNNATQWQSNIIIGRAPNIEHSEEVHTAASSLADNYHTYVLEWTPDYVAWFLDGEEVHRINGTSTVTGLTNPQSLRFNLWSHTSAEWVGPWDDSILPVYQFVNYIDYKAYNPATQSFEGGWRDDFDSFDTNRWAKANWTFDQNRVQFAPENALVKDGKLILALTHPDAMGFSGTPPTDAGEGASSGSTSSSASSQSSSQSSSASSEASSESSVSSVASTPSSSAVASSTPAQSGGGGGGALHFGWLLLLGSLMLLAKIRR